MKTQIQQQKQASRTLQSKTKAANQAPMNQILQTYSERNIQRQADFDEDDLLQGKFETAQREEIDDDELLQAKFDVSQQQTESHPLVGGGANNTGLPDNLKAGIENLSGYSMDDVQVHYNSPKPAQLQALAYTQGSDIHVAPGQEKHLPHEAWHVVQQKQGRVQPTMQLQGVNINDNKGLEKEADEAGAKAIQLKRAKFCNVIQCWRKKGVDEIIRNDMSKGAQKEIGIDIIDDIDREEYTILNVSNALTTRTYYNNDGTEEVKEITRNGWHNRAEKIIAINNKLTNIRASSTLAHEITHAHQHKRNEETTKQPFDSVFIKEVNAHIQQEIYNIKMGIPPKKAKFRTDVKINIDEIKKYIKKLYLGDDRKFKDVKSEYKIDEKIKPWQPLTGASL